MYKVVTCPLFDILTLVVYLAISSSLIFRLTLISPRPLVNGVSNHVRSCNQETHLVNHFESMLTLPLATYRCRLSMGMNLGG